MADVTTAPDETDDAAAPAHDETAASEQASSETGQDDPKFESSPADAADARPKRGRPRKAAAAKSQGIELVLTVTGNSDGTDWRAEVTHGSKRVVTALAVPASAVAAAAKDLHPDIAEAIETVLSAAREQQRLRVEQLQAELEAAQRALADLQD
ncbi:DUF6319 family protein [Actinopolymorpha alba]|uniref:DUF6319 family protein n=1 Tax=Actinopolymorpha alba TaxID=533267 RepID=UPI00036240D6|nr:DUF6319 family protein [Actinopolymorpha alba]